ncbi:MAG: hypothetical protein K9I85_10695 [Saprospiraceae bacterium]|nr:hypothetical protein [Saprospiraceae bacterium]
MSRKKLLIRQQAFPLMFVCLLATMMFTTQCTKDNGTGTVTIQLDHSVAGAPLELDQLKYTSQAGHTYSVVNLKYYMSEIRLTDKNGFNVSRGNINLFDIQDPSSARIELTQIPDGDYTHLSFVFGLNEIINVDGGLPNTVENINMEWPIPGDQGYHYMKFEGRYDSLNTGTIRSFNIHTGATKGNQNYLEFTLAIPTLALRDNNWTIQLNMDLNEWLQNPTTFDFVGQELIMMNQAAQEIIKANGASVFSITSVKKT